MSTPLTIVCEHCSATLKLKNPDLVGKKIKCPKCGEAFVVADVDQPVATKKPVKKKAKSDDDFLDDLDDSESPSKDDDDFDDYEEYDAPRTRRKSTSGKKTKKKSGSVDSTRFMTIAFSILGFAIVLVGGGFAVMSLIKGDGSSDLDWIPTNATGFVKVQMDDVWAAPIAQKLKASDKGKKLVEEFSKGSGIVPDDVDFVVIATFKGFNPQFMGVFRGKKPFDQDAIAKAEAAKLTNTGSAVYYLKDKFNALHFPDSRTMIRATEASIKELIERGKKHPSEAKFAFANGYRDHIVMAGLETHGGIASPFPSGETPETFLLRGNVTSDIRVSIETRFKDSATAKKHYDQSKVEIDKALKDMTTALDQVQKAPVNPMFTKEAATKTISSIMQIVKAFQTSQSGATVSSQVTIPGQVITDFVDMASSVPNSPLNRLPFSMGR